MHLWQWSNTCFIICGFPIVANSHLIKKRFSEQRLYYSAKVTLIVRSRKVTNCVSDNDWMVCFRVACWYLLLHIKYKKGIQGKSHTLIISSASKRKWRKTCLVITEWYDILCTLVSVMTKSVKMNSKRHQQRADKMCSSISLHT